MSEDTSHLQCLCGKIKESASLIEAKHYPVEIKFCHCDTCRQSSGALGNHFVKLTGRPSQATLDSCTVYTLPNGDVDRYFCSTCGSRTFDYVISADKWVACSGTLERKSSDGEDLVSIGSHVCVEDTKDGGLAGRLRTMKDRDIPCYSGPSLSDDQIMTPQELARLTETRQCTRNGGDADRLHASCRCGSIELHISPPTSVQQQNPATARWLRCDGTKYLALNCVCRYCRLAAGFTIASNTYVMPENIHVLSLDGVEDSLFEYSSSSKDSINFDADTQKIQARLPKMRFDFTSPGIRRSFCGSCGASIFFERTTRPQCVNIAVGLLRAESGSLAKDWIDFKWDDFCWMEQAVDPHMIQALEAST